MKQVKYLAAFGLFAVAGAANAGISSTVTLANDYDFRGITQSDENPAVQASLDYAHDSGFYVGAWASNIKFPGYDGDVELDGYAGFTGKIGESSSWDAGVIYYGYPDSSGKPEKAKILGFPEVYGAFTAGVFKLKLSYSNDYGGSEEDSYNLDGSVNVPLGKNFSLLAHAGYSMGDGVKAAAGDEYVDYSIGAGYVAGNFNFALKYVDTNREGGIDERVIFTVATTFPWK